MIYRVTKTYLDKHKRKVRVEGELINLSQERAAELKEYVEEYKGANNKSKERQRT